MDAYPEENVHPPTLEETTPEILTESFDAGASFLSNYGWYIFGFGVAFYILWVNKLRDAYLQWRKRLDDMSYDAKYHKDPDLFQDRQAKMEAARQKMQDELEVKAREFLEKQKEVEEAKRLEKIEDWERHEKGLGYRSKMKPKGDYNPLMGAGGSSGYRPPKKSCCSGGGCG